MVKIVLKSDPGAKVIVRYGESVYPDRIIRMPDPLFKEIETHVYSVFILGEADGLQERQLDFCFTATRYIQVDRVALEARKGLLVIHSAVDQHVSSASRRLGGMKTDKDDVNALINACYRSYVGNMFSYHTDCLQIEKFG